MSEMEPLGQPLDPEWAIGEPPSEIGRRDRKSFGQDASVSVIAPAIAEDDQLIKRARSSGRAADGQNGNGCQRESALPKGNEMAHGISPICLHDNEKAVAKGAQTKTPEAGHGR
jgi:hypothetical protein